MCGMKTWKSLVLVIVATAAVNAHAVALHDRNWSQAKSMPSAVNEQGSWSVELQEGRGLWASTKGDRGALGQYCSDEGACAWILVLWGAACAEGEQHPVLVNTDRSASHQVVQCMGMVPGIGSALAFVDFDGLDAALRRGSVVGIAIPEHTDAIGVAHFKLDGAAAAIDSMRERIVAQAHPE
jgi:hypothetical protein